MRRHLRWAAVLAAVAATTLGGVAGPAQASPAHQGTIGRAVTGGDIGTSTVRPATAPGAANAFWENFTSSTGIGIISPGDHTSTYSYVLGSGRNGRGAGIYVGPGKCVITAHKDTVGNWLATRQYAGQHFAGDSGTYTLSLC